MTELHLADGLALPLDAVTETFLIFGKKGSGKTATAGVFTEELIKAGLPVCVLDPMDGWWGLRSSADGQGPGLPVMILGGEHADVPLSPESGAAVADMIVDERVPTVLSLFLMSKTQQRRFVTEFMERLFQRNRDPLHLVIDECDRYAPQRGTGEMARLLGAYEDIVLRGRRLGIGSTSITLRPAQLNSAIRSQVEVLVAMRMLGKLDVQAIDEWVRLHATEEDARELKASLPSLPVGTAWFWSPGWLEVMAKVQVRRRSTFDSSATPKVGQQRIIPREFARMNEADLERIAARLGVPEAAEDAPDSSAEVGRLRGELARVRAQLAEARKPERIEIPALSDDDRAALRSALAALGEISQNIAAAIGPSQSQPRPAAAAPAPAPRAHREPAAAGADQPLGRAQRAILTVLAQFPDGRTTTQIAMLTGYSSKGGGFRNALGALRTAGLIERGELVIATADGIAALGASWEPLPQGSALLEHWVAQVGKAAGLALRELVAAWPGCLTREQVAARTGYSPDGGGFRNALGRLRTLELISGSGDLRADETLAREVTGG